MRALLRLALVYAADVAELFAILLFAGAAVLLGIALSPDAKPPTPHVVIGPVAYAEAE